MLLEHSALEVYYVEVQQYHGYLDEVLVWYDKFLVARYCWINLNKVLTPKNI